MSSISSLTLILGALPYWKALSALNSFFPTFVPHPLDLALPVCSSPEPPITLGTRLSSEKNTAYRALVQRSLLEIMLLLGAATAFKGDSARILLWSDLFKTSLPLGDDIDVPVLGALADNAKHNQTGRLDEHGALRHKHVELCGIGAVAIMFFAYFHIAGYPVPDFAPDFKDKDYGEYGRRDWYTYHVFSTGVGTTEMSYQAHHDRVMQMHAANDISITKVTHGTRPFAAQTARSFGASVSDTKALGGWNDSGSFKNCYDRAMPVAKDIALRQFLATLTWFRRVLIQDMAVIYTQTPHAPIFKTAPFNSTIFREFAAESTAAIHLAEEAARLAFQNLPEHLVASMRGVLATQNLGFERERHGYKMQMEAMQTQLNKVQSLLRVVAGSKRIKKAHVYILVLQSDNKCSLHFSSVKKSDCTPPAPVILPVVLRSVSGYVVGARAAPLSRLPEKLVRRSLVPVTGHLRSLHTPRPKALCPAIRI
ncbi:hypothetical protein C8R46DRAFT_1362266 [Mycena filopes]|nr:hypothetical protein C8R46DRAFT_1362266 [Mycena filopes]